MSKSTLLKLVSIPCFFFAYQFAAHGRTLNDNRALTIGILLFVAALALVACAVWIGRRT
jgi:hypothetical protein